MLSIHDAIDALSHNRRRLLAAWVAAEDGRGPVRAPVDRRRLVAYVVPADGALRADERTVDGDDLQGERVREWRAVYDAMYSAAPTHADPTFDTTGWNDTASSHPIAEADMREWLGHTVERITRLRPRRVLEIGCGTGLILFAVAPHVERYVATDFSHAALERLRATCTLEHVTLMERHAHDFDGFTEGEFDLVVLNSVVQYFPSAEYLLDVLTGALRLLSPHGHLFLGDIRSQPLLDAWHLSVELARARPDDAARRLRDLVRRRVADDHELALSPTFFDALPARLADIAAIEVEPKRGRSQDEMTRFRYDVVLRKTTAEAPPEPRRVEWTRSGWTPASFRDWLSREQPDVIRVVGVPCARVHREVRALALMDGAECPRTVAEVDALATDAARAAVCVEELAVAGYDLHLRWSDVPGCLDLLLRRGAPASWLQPPSPTSRDLLACANAPLSRTVARRLIPVLRRHLQDVLPDYMVPSSFVWLDALPRLPSGKKDRRALPGPDDQPRLEQDYVAPRTPLEEQLAAIWSELLGNRRVGVQDNFFAMGGHSLLATQLISRVRRRFKVDILLRSIFEEPTIARQAEEVERLVIQEIEGLSEDAARQLSQETS